MVGFGIVGLGYCGCLKCLFVLGWVFVFLFMGFLSKGEDVEF